MTSETRFITCQRCNGEGRIYCAIGNDPEPRDSGRCLVCNGSCVEEIEDEPLTLADLEIWLEDTKCSEK